MDPEKPYRHKGKCACYGNGDFNRYNDDRVEHYRFESYDNHIIMNLEGKRVLIDSGSSVSIGNNPITLMGQIFHGKRSLMGVTLEKINDLIGVELDYILGSEIFKKFHILINYDTREVVFANRSLASMGDFHDVLQVKSLLNVPTVNISVADKPLQVFFDTGANLSYCRSSYLQDFPVVGEARDFYPGFGFFETNIYQVPIEISGKKFEMLFGVLPQLLEFTLLFSGCGGILGNDLFSFFNPIYFNLSDKMICLQGKDGNVHIGAY